MGLFTSRKKGPDIDDRRPVGSLPNGPKLAGVRYPGFGLRTWDSPRYQIPGVSPSHVTYNIDEDDHDEGFHTRQHAGVHTEHGRRALTSPSITRNAVVASQFSSLAALPIFQSFANVRWSQSLAGVIARPDHPALSGKNWNPNAQGAQEMQKIQPYDPWPSSGVLYPKAL